jgi:hypothetical protein
MRGKKKFTFFLIGRGNVLSSNINSICTGFLSILLKIDGERSSDGSFWNEVVRPSLISKKFQHGSIICSDTWKAFTVSLREGTSTVSLITAKNSTAMEKEIKSMVWRDSGDI